jgi:NAD(P)-dependent dehydrogenase (short-subunit alcohol dehydrogenase family)
MASNTIVFITGANTGLGLETVKSLYRSPNPYTILLGGRNLSKADDATEEVQKEYPSSQSTVEPVEIDIESDESIEKAFDTISAKYDRLDVLINNAGKLKSSPLILNRANVSEGASFDQSLADGSMTLRQMWNKSWNVNVSGTFITTHTFVPLLLKSAEPRLLFITSGTATLAEHENQALPINRSPPKGWPKPTYMVPAYRSSKTGLNMMMREWTRLLKEDGVKVVAISPGMLATGLGGNPAALKAAGALDPQIGADFIRIVVEGGRDHDTGKAIRREMVQPW